MTLELGTPALLFPAISLLLLAYTNRYLSLASLVRELHAKRTTGLDRQDSQIKSLRRRISIIRLMQILGVLSFLFCTISMFLLYIQQSTLGILAFGLSLLLLMASLGSSVAELLLSVEALNIELEDCKDPGKEGCRDL